MLVLCTNTRIHTYTYIYIYNSINKGYWKSTTKNICFLYFLLTLYGPNSFFRRFSGLIGATHRRDAHRKFFDDSFLK